MQIDIFRELTGILDSCEGVDPFSETNAAKNTFLRETTKRNSRLVPLIDIFSLKRFPMQVFYCGRRNEFMAKGTHHCLER